MALFGEFPNLIKCFGQHFFLLISLEHDDSFILLFHGFSKLHGHYLVNSQYSGKLLDNSFCAISLERNDPFFCFSFHGFSKLDGHYLVNSQYLGKFLDNSFCAISLERNDQFFLLLLPRVQQTWRALFGEFPIFREILGQ